MALFAANWSLFLAKIELFAPPPSIYIKYVHISFKNYTSDRCKYYLKIDQIFELSTIEGSYNAENGANKNFSKFSFSTHFLAVFNL